MGDEHHRLALFGCHHHGDDLQFDPAVVRADPAVLGFAAGPGRDVGWVVLITWAIRALPRRCLRAAWVSSSLTQPVQRNHLLFNTCPISRDEWVPHSEEATGQFAGATPAVNGEWGNVGNVPVARSRAAGAWGNVFGNAGLLSFTQQPGLAGDRRPVWPREGRRALPGRVRRRSESEVPRVRVSGSGGPGGLRRRASSWAGC